VDVPAETLRPSLDAQAAEVVKPRRVSGQGAACSAAATDSPQAQAPGGAAWTWKRGQEKRREGNASRKAGQAWGVGKTLKGARRDAKNVHGLAETSWEEADIGRCTQRVVSAAAPESL